MFELKSPPSIWTQRYNEYLTNLVIPAHTVSFGTSFYGQTVLYLVPKSKLRNEYYMLHVNHFSYLFTGDRSHVIERSLNRRTGDEDRKQNFINLDESEFGHVIFFLTKIFFMKEQIVYFKPQFVTSSLNCPPHQQLLVPFHQHYINTQMSDCMFLIVFNLLSL